MLSFTGHPIGQHLLNDRRTENEYDVTGRRHRAPPRLRAGAGQRISSPESAAAISDPTRSGSSSDGPARGPALSSRSSPPTAGAAERPSTTRGAAARRRCHRAVEHGSSGITSPASGRPASRRRADRRPSRATRTRVADAPTAPRCSTPRARRSSVDAQRDHRPAVDDCPVRVMVAGASPITRAGAELRRRSASSRSSSARHPPGRRTRPGARRGGAGTRPPAPG